MIDAYSYMTERSCSGRRYADAVKTQVACGEMDALELQNIMHIDAPKKTSDTAMNAKVKGLERFA